MTNSSEGSGRLLRPWPCLIVHVPSEETVVVQNPPFASPPFRNNRPPDHGGRRLRQLHSRPRVQGFPEGAGGLLRREARRAGFVVDGRGSPPAPGAGAQERRRG